jgi:hypothetical protein
MASLMRKLKKGTKDKIIHSTFDLGRSILDALEEQMTEDTTEEKKDEQQP